MPRVDLECSRREWFCRLRIAPMDSPRPSQPRPFLGILMRCCNVYARIFMTAAGDAYAGHCPRCMRPVRVPIVAEGGSTRQFFEAG